MGNTTGVGVGEAEADPAIVEQGIELSLQAQEFPDHGALQSSH